jgi:hypothetical protein
LDLADLNTAARAAYRHIGVIRDRIIDRETSPYRLAAEAALADYMEAKGHLEKLRQRTPTTPAAEPAAAHGASPPRVATEAASPDSTSDIKDAVLKRGIRNLVHFSRIDNLLSILRHGIIPRDQLERRGDLDFRFNDQSRSDCALDHSCLSVSHPNYLMLYKHMMKRHDREREWCVLQLKPEILWQLPCIFCPTNASKRGTLHCALMLGHTAAGFEAMFPDPVLTPHGLMTRLELFGAAPNSFYPSDPQAEVLVRGTISHSYIAGILVHDTRALSEAEAAIESTGCKATATINQRMFRYRRDWACWKPRD